MALSKSAAQQPKKSSVMLTSNQLSDVPAQIELLKASAKELRPKLDIQDRKYRLKKYRRCFVGQEAVSKIIECGFALDEVEAVAFGNKLMVNEIIQHVESEHWFKNEPLFYRFVPGVLKGAKTLEEIVKRRVDSAESPNAMRDRLIRKITETDGLFEPVPHDHHDETFSPGTPTGGGPNAFTYSSPVVSPDSTHRIQSPSSATKSSVYSQQSQHSQLSPRSNVAPFQFSNQVNQPKNPFVVSNSQSTNTSIGNVQSVHTSPHSTHSQHSPQNVIFGLQSQLQTMFNKIQQLEALCLNNQRHINHIATAPKQSDIPQKDMQRSASESTEGRSTLFFATGDIDNFEILDKKDIPKSNEDILDVTPQLQKPWRNYGQQYGTFKVHKIGPIVHLQGCVTGGKVDQVICTLPNDCRPSGVMVFMFDQHGHPNGRLSIDSNGNVVVKTMNQAWVYLDGISFVASSVLNQDDEKEFTPQLENGWSEYKKGFAEFKVFKTGSTVHCQGCVFSTTGQIGADAFVCRLPKGCRPSGMLTFCFDQNGRVNGRLRVTGDGVIFVEFMTNNMVYLDSVSFVAVH